MNPRPDTPSPAADTPLGADLDPELAFTRWREAHLRQIDEDYQAWRQSGARSFPEDFDSWRSARRELVAEQSAAGLPLVSATEDAPESEKAQLLFERS